MSYSSDAAEQVVRMSLEGGGVAVKIAGVGARQAAILLYTVLQQQQKTQGKTRLTNMLKSGKELRVFAVRDTELKTFCKAAKNYGVLYCVLKDRDATDGITDIMVRAEDAAKINRIFERFQLSTVTADNVKNSEAAKTARTSDNLEQFLDELLRPDKEERERSNPAEARTEEKPRFEPTSERSSKAEKSITDGAARPSVRRELQEIRTAQKKRQQIQPPQTERTENYTGQGHKDVIA